MRIISNKRFQVIWKCLDDSTEFQDNLTKTIFTVQDVCELLNELSEENKRLKKQRDCVYGDLTRLKKDYLKLTDENENLKAQNKLIKMEIEEMRKLWESK